MGEETVYLIFNPAEVQVERGFDAEKQINALPTWDRDESEDQALLGRTC